MFQESVTPEQTDPMLTAALGYARRGWRVFPNNRPVVLDDGTVACSCSRGDKCSEKHKGKHPRPAGWQKRATTNAAMVRRFWSNMPTRDWRNSNIGIACGRASNLLVLDVDQGEGEGNLTEILAQDLVLPTTVTVITGGGGRQFYFTHPDLDFDPPSKAGLCGLRGIDVRCDGGQVVAPPSMHRSGKRYRFAEGLSPDDVPIADPPDWLVEMLRRDGRPRGSTRIHGLPRPTPPEPATHIEHLHPHFSCQFGTTRAGHPRKNIQADLREAWVADPSSFETETRVLSHLHGLWLPTTIRSSISDDLHSEGTLVLAHDYETTTPGGNPVLVEGGTLVFGRFGARWGPSICDDRLWMRLLLGRLRIAVPWPNRETLDTILIPIHILRADGRPVDIWGAEPQDRSRLMAPFMDAVGVISEMAGTELQVSFWAEGLNEIWLAVHSSESLPGETLIQLRTVIIDLALRSSPRYSFRDDRGHPWRGSRTESSIVYRIGPGNLGPRPCPIPFSFHPSHPDRMMMSLDPVTGEWHDQVEFLLSLRRQPLSPVTEALPAITMGLAVHHRARHGAMELMGLSGSVSDDRIAENLDTPLGRAMLWQAERDMNCGLPSPPPRGGSTSLAPRSECGGESSSAGTDTGPSISALSRPTPERLASDEIGQCACVGDAAAPTGALPDPFEWISFFRNDTATSSSGPEGYPTPPPPPPTLPNTNIVVHKFGADRWRSRLPAEIPGLHSTMIGKGFLARILAVMRDDGLLDEPEPGAGILLELEDEVIERYCGEDSDEDARLELRDFIKHALPDLDSFFASGLQLSPLLEDGCRRMAENIHSRLSTRGSENPLTVDDISSLLRTLVIKSGFQRQAEFTLDFIAVRAGWAEDIGTNGVNSVTKADRSRISRFLSRICQDYRRDCCGRIMRNGPTPLLPLIRCERKGHQGTPSLYTFLWENWGEAFASLCAIPCPRPRGDVDPIGEMMAAGFIVRPGEWRSRES